MVRGHAMYGSPYRNYNSRGGGGVGFGRGHPKRFQPPPPQPPPHKGGVFEEAGRLAAEYLVSKGLLPSNALTGKWKNGNNSFKNRDFQFLRAQQEGDNNLQDSRTTALARLGGDAADGAGYGSGRRRSVEDFNPNASRDYLKGRKRMGSFKGYGSDGNREFGRSGSWSDKAKVSPDMEGSDNATFTGYMEQQAYSDTGSEEQKSLPSSSELSLKHDTLGNSEPDPDKKQSPEEVGLNVNSSSVTRNDITAEANLALTENNEGMKIVSAGTAESEKGSSNGELEKVSDPEDKTIKHCEEGDNPANFGGSDLIALSRFANVPTRTRSSLTTRGLKTDPILIAEDENPTADELARESAGPPEEVCTDVSLPDESLNQNRSLKYFELSEAAVGEDGTQLGLVYKVGQGLCTRSKSFPQRSFVNEVESSEGEFGFSRSSSLVIERGEKRTLKHCDDGEAVKRPREWNPSDSQAAEYVHLSNSMESQQISHEEKPSGEKAILDADQQKGMDIHMYSNRDTEPCNDHAEEKQLFPCSFKICDLNLMEASDVHENHEVNPVLIFPSIPQIKKEAAPVDIDLSMSSNGNTINRNGTSGTDSKDIEVIDLEIDSVHDKAFNNSEQKDDALFTGFESFPEQAQSANEIPDGQDGYGLMISELLGADIPNCSPVQPDINSLHNDMGIHNGEGILGDDDSIYMSLGEIPISMPEI